MTVYTDERQPTGHRRTVPPHIADQLALFAESAGGDGLLAEAEVAARVRLRTHGRFSAWQIKLDLIMAGRMDGKEKTACFGALNRRLDVTHAGRERVPSVVPGEYLVRGTGEPTPAVRLLAMQKVLDDSHNNLNSTWVPMTAAQKSEAAQRALEALTHRKGGKEGSDTTDRQPHASL